MATYVITGAWDKSLALKAVTYEIRVVRVEVENDDYEFNAASGAYDYYPLTTDIFRYTSGTPSGGTAVTPSPLRQGAPAATATSWSGATAPAGTATTVGRNFAGSPSIGTWDPPGDLTLSLGAVLFLPTPGTITQGAASYQIYFEELRLSWHY